MLPLAASRRHRTPLPVARIWFLAAVGVLVTAGGGVFSWHGERQPPAPSGPGAPRAARPSASAPASTSAPLQTARSFPSVQTATGADEEAAWSEEEKEAIRVRAQNAPGVVASWATALPVGGNRRFALETAALAWGDSDPAAAAQWARTLADDAERVIALGGIAGEAVRSDPALALELACSLPEAARDELVPRATMEWAAQDPAAAADWARRITGESLRAKVLAGIATVWSDQDPVKGATLAAMELPAGRLQADAVVTIVQRWAQRSPADAAGWVLQFPDGDLRDTVMDTLVRYAPEPP